MKSCLTLIGWCSHDGTEITGTPEAVIAELHEKKGVCQFFTGLITLDQKEHCSSFEGVMIDRFGRARIAGKIFGEGDNTVMELARRYSHQTGVTQFRLTLLPEPGQNFRGRYESILTGRGEAYLSLFEVSRSFFAKKLT